LSGNLRVLSGSIILRSNSGWEVYWPRGSFVMLAI